MLSVNPTTPAMVAWSNALEVDPSFPIGSSQTKDFDGTLVEAKAEVHTWWGAHPERPPAPHKGISLYYADAHGAAAASPARLEGLDVSDYQPEATIDWKKAAKRFAYVFVKASQGTSNTAHDFAAHYAGAKKAGIPRGAYHFISATSSAEDQIAHFFDVVGDELGELPPVLDAEWQGKTKALGPLSADAFAKLVLDCLALLAKGSEKRPILYTAPGFWSLLAKVPGFAAACAAISDLWIAHYGVKTVETLGWPRWAFWQWSATEPEEGVTTRGDANFFCGTAKDFARYLADGTLPPLDPSTPLGLQMALNALGASPPLVEDGVLGPKTKAALVRYQAAQGLPRSGVVDAQTLAALRTDLS
jgi:lysozyme